MPTINVKPDSGDHLQHIADVIAKSKKIVVVTGAGISTNCGIPDFRSENGLYSLIQAQYDAAAAITKASEVESKSQEVPDFPEERPLKRRRLTRSVSTTALAHENKPERRKLRSSLSLCVSVEASTTSIPTSTPSIPSLLPVSSQCPEPIQPLSQSSQCSSHTRQSLPNLKGKDLFDSMIWSDAFTTSIFYTFISTLRRKVREEVTTTTKTHRFLRTLRDGGRLVRVYTQNIDGLESREGLSMDLERGPGNRSRFGPRIIKTTVPSTAEDVMGTAVGLGTQPGRNSNDSGGVECVPLHGGLHLLRCGLCAKLCDWDESREDSTLAGMGPDCPHCTSANQAREHRGRRSLAIGRLRPDVVLYGEEHPCAHQIGPLITHDLSLGPEVLLILGTSLRVHGLKVMVKEFAKAVHSRGGKVVFVNQTKPPDSIWGEVIDFWVESDCDRWVEDLNARREEIWLPQTTTILDGEGSKAKDVKSKPAPKNPQSMRTCTTNGAYLTHKIHNLLRELTKSRTSKKTVCNEDQKLVDAQIFSDQTKVDDDAFTIHVDAPPLKKRHKKSRVSQLERPGSTSPDAPASAPVASISANLRKQSEGRPRFSDLAAKVRNLCDKDISRQLPVLPGLEHYRPRPPLSKSNGNMVAKTRRPAMKNWPHSVCQTIESGDEQQQLPTPPGSDEPLLPVLIDRSPRTPTGIRSRMSISSLLSSPPRSSS